MRVPEKRSLNQLRLFEARLAIDGDRRGGYSSVQIQVGAYVNQHGWFTQCKIGGRPGDEAAFICDVCSEEGSTWTCEYSTPAVSVTYGAWYTARMETDPSTALFRYYLNGSLVGIHTPTDSETLRAVHNLEPHIGLWNGEPNAASTRYVDDVRITPAGP